MWPSTQEFHCDGISMKQQNVVKKSVGTFFKSLTQKSLNTNSPSSDFTSYQDKQTNKQNPAPASIIL